jgi:hypothetical protein
VDEQNKNLISFPRKQVTVKKVGATHQPFLFFTTDRHSRVKHCSHSPDPKDLSLKWLQLFSGKNQNKISAHWLQQSSIKCIVALYRVRQASKHQP